MEIQSGNKMAVGVCVLFLVMVSMQRADCSCTFPSALSGTWRSSRWGIMNFTSSSLVYVYNMVGVGDVEFECETSSGTIYIIRSTQSMNILGNTVDIVSCLDLNQVTSTKYYYYHASSELTLSGSLTEPVKLVNPPLAMNTGTACDISPPYTTGTNHMLIKTGYETAAATQCPNPMLATYNNYTVDKGSGAQCGGVGYINVCNDRQSITVDYTVCAETVLYSTAGNLQCVYYSTSGSTHYVNVYNFDTTVDGSTTFRFSCVAIAYGSNGDVLATQYPMACDSTQDSTTVPSSPYQGGTFQLVANVTCIPSSSSSSVSSSIIIIIVVVILLLLLLIALAIYHLKYKKRWATLKRKLPCFKEGGKSSVKSMKSKKVTEINGETAPQKEAKEAQVVDQNINEEDKSDLWYVPTERPLSSVPPRDDTSPATSDQKQQKLHVPLTDGKGIQTSLDPSIANMAPRRLPPLETTHADHPAVPTDEAIMVSPRTG